MKVIKLTKAQADRMRGNYSGNEFNPILDANGNWIVGLNVLTNGNFLELRTELLTCPQIDYSPIQIPE